MNVEEMDMAEVVALALWWRARELGTRNEKKMRQKALRVKEVHGWSEEELEENARRCYEWLTRI